MDLVWLSNQSSNWTEFGIMRDRPNFEAIPQQYHIYLILLYTSTATFALVGNLVTLVVLKNSKRTSRNLSKYLINLSCSDLLMASFSIPFTYTMFMYGQWYFEPRFCPVVLAIQFYSAFVSVYTLVAIGIDRYIAIKMPIRSKTIMNLTNLIIGTIWMAGLLLSSIFFQISEATPIDIGNETMYVCREILDEDQAKVMVLSVFCLIFLVPVSILAYVYGSMAVVIFRRDLKNSASLMLKRQRRKIIKILMVVVEAFIFCWAPLQVFNVVIVFFPQVRTFNSEGELNRYVITFFAFHWLAMGHSCVNPIIYGMCSTSFRKEFLNLFCKRLSFAHIRSSFRGKSTSVQYIEN